MNTRLRGVLAVILTGIWVNASEFFRNEILLKNDWIEHYQKLGMVFPSTPVNALIWIAWGFLFASAIFFISRKFRFFPTALICWFTGFVLMWLVAFNLSVLPANVLLYALPLSLLEAFLGSYICLRVSPKSG